MQGAAQDKASASLSQEWQTAPVSGVEFDRSMGTSDGVFVAVKPRFWNAPRMRKHLRRLLFLDLGTNTSEQSPKRSMLKRFSTTSTRQSVIIRRQINSVKSGTSPLRDTEPPSGPPSVRSTVYVLGIASTLRRNLAGTSFDLETWNSCIRARSRSSTQFRRRPSKRKNAFSRSPRVTPSSRPPRDLSPIRFLSRSFLEKTGHR